MPPKTKKKRSRKTAAKKPATKKKKQSSASVKKKTTKKKVTTREEQNILWFKEVGIKDVHLVGGKNASLGEMYSQLTKKGIRVPNGFAVTAHAYWDFLRATGLEKRMKKALHGLDVTNVRELTRVGKKVRNMILKASFSKTLEKEISKAYAQLSKQAKTKNLAVAVRSSATAEDLPDASFAGQQESYLNVVGEKELLRAVKKCVASLFTARAISYREGQGYDHMDVALSVVVQQMVGSDTGSSGVMFTMDTESGFDGVTLVTSSYGLGEYVVKGRVVPDQFYIFDEGVKKGKDAIISKTLGTKDVKLVYGAKSGTLQVSVPKKDRNVYSISDKDVVQLAKWGAMIEAHYNRPQDIEWAKDGKTGKLFIVQARPETVKAQNDHAFIEKYTLKKTGKQVLSGVAVGQKIGAGKVRIIDSPKHLKYFKKGDVLVTRITDPDWEPIMRIASAIVTEQGGKTSHAAIVSRELGVPCVVGAHKARKVLKNGQKVTVSCAKGDEGIVYRGILPFEVKRTEITNIPKTKTKVQMIVGDPDHAFQLSFLPHEGVGLARLEFIFSSFIRIHPLALIHYDKLKDKRAKKKIREMTRGYKKKSDFCVDKLAEGMGRIAAAMYPHDVVVRMSDFKTNEYATLIGGKDFEPKEENPMLGWRGASRYYSKEYEAGFKLECEALKRVRNDWGLDNVIPMIPFCRTPEEGEKVLGVMKKNGLERGKDGLKVYVMCEIPSNVILAEEYAKIFDGFSIGSNDLTQMTLGVDRDSSLVSHISDPNSPAVKRLISDVIKTAHKYKRKVGICGQAPSDYPEFAEFLVNEKIDSISLNPDSIVETKRHIAKVERTVGKVRKGSRGSRANKKYLSIVAGFAIVAAGLMGLGAGCAEVNPFPEASSPMNQEASPAEIRELGVEQARRDQAAHMSTMHIDQGPGFSISYPSMWDIAQLDGATTFSSSETRDEYVKVRIVTQSLIDTQTTQLVVGEKTALRYMINDSVATDVVDVSLGDGDVLRIEGRSDAFDDIVSSVRFVDESVRVDGVCAQVITYGRSPESGECVTFPTPCDVPSGWESQSCPDDVQRN